MNAKRLGLDDNCKGRLLSPRFHSTLTMYELLSAGLGWFQILHEREKKLCKLDSLMSGNISIFVTLQKK